MSHERRLALFTELKQSWGIKEAVCKIYAFQEEEEEDYTLLSFTKILDILISFHFSSLELDSSSSRNVADWPHPLFP